MCCQLYEDERRTAAQLQMQLAGVRQEMSDLRLELDRLRNSSSVSAADITNDRRVAYELLAAAHVSCCLLFNCVRQQRIIGWVFQDQRSAVG